MPVVIWDLVRVSGGKKDTGGNVVLSDLGHVYKRPLYATFLTCEIIIIIKIARKFGMGTSKKQNWWYLRLFISLAFFVIK